MPTYNKGDEKKYFPMVIAALIVLAVAIAGFVFSLVSKSPQEIDGVIIEESEDGTIMVSPGPGLATPEGPPNLPMPTSPPPSN